MDFTLKDEFHAEGEKFSVGPVTFRDDALFELNRGCTHAFEGLLILHAKNESPSTPRGHKAINEIAINNQGGVVWNWVRIAGSLFFVTTDIVPDGENETYVILAEKGGSDEN